MRALSRVLLGKWCGGWASTHSMQLAQSEAIIFPDVAAVLDVTQCRTPGKSVLPAVVHEV